MESEFRAVEARASARRQQQQTAAIAPRQRTKQPQVICEPPLAYRIRHVMALTNIGHSKLYEMMATGELPYRIVAGRRLILRRDVLKLIGAEEEA
jgi:predicted DNA-binding transcriptional regulator AlpA